MKAKLWIALIALLQECAAHAAAPPSIAIPVFVSDLSASRVEVTVGVRNQQDDDINCTWELRGRSVDRAKLLPEIQESPAPWGRLIRATFPLDETQGSLASHALVRTCQGRVTEAKRSKTLHPIPADPKATLKFSVIADSQGEAAEARWIVSAIEKAQSDFVIHAGDVVDHGEKLEEWRAWFDELNELTSVRLVATALGNHDYDQYSENPPDGWRTRPTAGIWDALSQGRRWRVLEFPQARIFLLDSNLHSMSRSQWQAQLDWLKEELVRPDPTNRIRIAVFHHPPFANSVHNWDQLRDTPSQPHEYIRIRSELVPLLESGGVKLVLNGHAHHYERSFKNAITYVTAGAINTWRMVPSPPAWFDINPYSQKLLTLKWTITHCTLIPTNTTLACTTQNRAGEVVDEFEIRWSNNP